ncbi:hypothetical protein HDU67_006591 [Dinochytrium kinnereticum]|nr:hypothetical protein HDU67_006591 [Dinochytrium kinnereticum]
MASPSPPPPPPSSLLAQCNKLSTALTSLGITPPWENDPAKDAIELIQDELTAALQGIVAPAPKIPPSSPLLCCTALRDPPPPATPQVATTNNNNIKHTIVNPHDDPVLFPRPIPNAPPPLEWPSEYLQKTASTTTSGASNGGLLQPGEVYLGDEQTDDVAKEPFEGHGGGVFGSFLGGDVVSKVFCEEAPATGRRSIVSVEIRINPKGNFTCNGTVFPDLDGLVNLRKLTITGCDMNGATIPWRSFARVTYKLEHIALVSNNITGRIPADIGEIRNLTSLRLDGNRIEGILPAAVGRLGNLEILRLSGNLGMNGVLPPSMAGMKKLDWM